MIYAFESSLLNLALNMHIVYQQIIPKELFFILKVGSH